ncbi:hypothetical protein ACFWBX_05220 [Streptomyces sp. NPDC059991]|uniref:hypothetical protein n=1 Tax=Streptomyces sp. NPDC059991 TaxID=3347028 RepID=UPI0036B5AD8C
MGGLREAIRDTHGATRPARPGRIHPYESGAAMTGRATGGSWPGGDTAKGPFTGVGGPREIF